MRVTVLLFANLAESLGTDRLLLDLSEGASVHDALDLLAKRHEAIASMRGSLAFAVDEAYATADTTLREGCAVALIPPVSGG